MASHSRLEVWTAIVDSGLVPLFYHAEVEIARRILRACAQAGVRCVEFTNRGDPAPLVFQDLVRRRGEELGAEICKICPGGQVGGPEFIKAILGPMPWARLMPTGGVEATQESVNAWIKAGAACLGIGSNLVTKQSVAAGEFDAIGERAGHILGWIRAARGGELSARRNPPERSGSAAGP